MAERVEREQLYRVSERTTRGKIMFGCCGGEYFFIFCDWMISNWREQMVHWLWEGKTWRIMGDRSRVFCRDNGNIKRHNKNKWKALNEWWYFTGQSFIIHFAWHVEINLLLVISKDKRCNILFPFKWWRLSFLYLVLVLLEEVCSVVVSSSCPTWMWSWSTMTWAFRTVTRPMTRSP